MNAITDELTRADIVTALLHLSATAQRLPSHYVDRRASLHVQMNMLIRELEVRGELRESAPA